MLLSESLVWALGEYDISGVKVLCDESICDEVSNFFHNDFSNKWDKALLKVEKDFGDCEPAEFPISIIKEEYGFFISVGALDIRYAGGNYYDITCGVTALKKALKCMKETYPHVEYEGYFGCALSDVRSGEAWQSDMSSIRDVKTYDHVGRILGSVFATELYDPEDASNTSEFWEYLAELFENYEDDEETIKVLYAYSNWIKKTDLDRAIGAILDLASQYDEEWHEELVELVDQFESDECDFEDML